MILPPKYGDSINPITRIGVIWPIQKGAVHRNSGPEDRPIWATSNGSEANDSPIWKVEDVHNRKTALRKNQEIPSGNLA